MTREKLTTGWDLAQEIDRRKNDLEKPKRPFISLHGCSGQPTASEKKLEERIQAFYQKVVGEELKRLEKEFARL